MSISTASAQAATLTRYRFVAAGGETSVSGTDANGNTLSYVAGMEQVYLNGVMLVRGQDYTATNGSSVTSLTALVASDVVEVLTFSQFVITNAVDQTLVDFKGDLLVGTADNTIARLGVGSNNTLLVADSTQTPGIKWASTLSGLTLTTPVISSISNTGTLTLPTSTDTLVGRATTDTLTNKTLTAPAINLSVNAQTGTTYTFALGDNGQLVTASNASAQTYSIPTNATTAFPIGTQINIIQIGAGQVTITAATSGTTTVASTGATAASPKLRVQYSSATCIKVATDTWYVVGDIA